MICERSVSDKESRSVWHTYKWPWHEIEVFKTEDPVQCKIFTNDLDMWEKCFKVEDPVQCDIFIYKRPGDVREEFKVKDPVLCDMFTNDLDM